MAATIASIEDISDQTAFAKKQRETVIAHLKDEKSANLQLVFAPVTGHMIGSQEDQSKLLAPVEKGRNYSVTLVACLQYPVSRGSIHVRSSNVEDQPDIDPAYLRHEADLDVLAAGVKFLNRATKAEPLASKLNGQRHFPPPELDLEQTADAKKAILDWYVSEYHPCGSLAMGDAVDTGLRVKGVKGLRVADASVFPGHISGNMLSSVYMIGERIADLIQEDWEDTALKR